VGAGAVFGAIGADGRVVDDPTVVPGAATRGPLQGAHMNKSPNTTTAAISIILPPLRAANFDIIWFGVVMTIVMEMGLIHPPVGLNIFVIRNVAPDIPLSEAIWGTLPFVLLMMVAVLLLCFFPGISTGLPDLVMGPDGGR
jgi:TRAP-type C4-dicarboxylate transport system permease large subunit